jgi:DNA-nicking Smr family endonuclease
MAKKNVSAEDSDLFRQAIGQVKRIETDKILQPPTKPAKKISRSNLPDDADWLRDNPEESNPVGHEQSISFTAPGIQKNVLAKLRKGFFGIDAELDLHGYTSNAAQQRLLQFLNMSAESGRRCVHIIHGKGYRSEEDWPVLKNHLNLWLRQHKSVQAFCSTPQRYGGAGAVWVLLKVSS